MPIERSWLGSGLPISTGMPYGLGSGQGAMWSQSQPDCSLQAGFEMY